MLEQKIKGDLASRPLSMDSGTKESLCFDKNDFMKANFSVDEFLHKNRTAPSLEQLRDNLGLYLKGLRASMIDLINEDYADFVSLSANLVGLDQSIDTIKQPLQQFRDEFQSIQTLIQQNAAEIHAQLEAKRQLRELQRNLESLKKVYKASAELQQLLTQQLNDAVQMERAALALIQLQFHTQFCVTYLNAEQLAEHKSLQAQVQAQLRQLFNVALKSASSTCTEPLERCLRIYITLDACAQAEQVFREDVVSPYLSAIISEQSLQNSPQGLAGIYSRILNFISLHMTDLLRLTLYTDKLRGFNFLVHSFWAEVEQRLELHLSSIFAPGNAEIFYAKYTCTRDFLTKIEQLLAQETALQAFRQHEQTRSFQARWNLPVYFQICFQNIAGQFEATLEPLPRDVALGDRTIAQTHEFQLAAFCSAHQAMQHCFAEGIYLPEIFPKFFKLHVQIVLRLSRWLTQVLTSGAPVQLLYIALHMDVQKFIDLLPEVQHLVFGHMPQSRRTSSVSEAVHKSYGDMLQILLEQLGRIRNVLVQTLLTESGGAEQLRQVNDLPRLYRKTNRDVPTRCSNYVELLLRPLKAFATQQTSQLGQDVVEEVLAQVCSRISSEYYLAVSDVLTSVQKTEESLRRLRNLKSSGTTTPATGTMSDDDKIRQQLRVDVVTWTNELEKLNLLPAQIDKLQALNSIVDESIKIKP